MPFGASASGPSRGSIMPARGSTAIPRTGDAALALNVGRQRVSSLRGSLGAEVRGDFGGGGVQLRPYAAALLEKDFRGDDRTLDLCADQRAGHRQPLARRGGRRRPTAACRSG